MASTGVAPFGACGGVAKRSAKGLMMRLMAHGDQRFDLRVRASGDIRRAVIAVVRQHSLMIRRGPGPAITPAHPRKIEPVDKLPQLPRQTEPDVFQEASRPPREATRTQSRDRSGEIAPQKTTHRPANHCCDSSLCAR